MKIRYLGREMDGTSLQLLFMQAMLSRSLYCSACVITWYPLRESFKFHLTLSHSHESLLTFCHSGLKWQLLKGCYPNLDSAPNSYRCSIIIKCLFSSATFQSELLRDFSLSAQAHAERGESSAELRWFHMCNQLLFSILWDLISLCWCRRN